MSLRLLLDANVPGVETAVPFALETVRSDMASEDQDELRRTWFGEHPPEGRYGTKEINPAVGWRVEWRRFFGTSTQDDERHDARRTMNR